MKLKEFRDRIRLIFTCMFSIIYLPHYICYLVKGGANSRIFDDVQRDIPEVCKNMPISVALLYKLHTNRYFRTLFYYRIDPILSSMIQWYRPGDKYFVIPYSTVLEGGVKIAHPYATVLNADYIGRNFSVVNCTTIGKQNDDRPTIGDDVSVGANVLIIGKVKIGNNVTIGAGAVVVKDIPDNAIVVGNPGHVIKYKTT